MFSKIIIATDGSRHANQALEVAIDLTKKYNAELTIAHVLTHDHPKAEIERMLEVEHLVETPSSATISIPASDEHGMMRSGDHEEKAITVIGQQLLKAAASRVSEAGIENAKTSILSGDYANAILELAEKKNADIIIMGRRGLNTLKGLIIGSVSYKVEQRAQCSVLTVK